MVANREKYKRNTVLKFFKTVLRFFCTLFSMKIKKKEVNTYEKTKNLWF